MKKDLNLTGKTLLFVNSGGKKKKFTLEKAKKLGANIVLLNKTLDVSKNLVNHFIEADNYNHGEVIEKLHFFLKQHPELQFDGAITFWEDDVPLLARICDEFNLPGNNYDTAIKTRNKYEMRKRLKETGLGNPKFALVKTPKDLQVAVNEVGFPAVMKPVWGSDSEFVVLVKNEEEAANTLNYLLKNCTEQFNAIFKYNDGAFLFEEYMDGMEVSVEGFSQFGIPNVIGIHEKQPIKPPYFIEYGDIAPARIESKMEQEVIKLAESALIALGVQNSLSHIEIKITSEGPKIVEVASRMGGDDIYFNVKHVWGVDMVEAGVQVATNMPVNFKRKEPKDKVICRYFIPEFSGIVTKIQNLKEVQKMKNVLQVTVNKSIGDPVLVPPAGFDNTGWAIVKGKTYQEAETLMNKLLEKITINITKFHKDSSLGKTTRKPDLASASRVRSQILRASKIEKIRSINLQALQEFHIGIVTNEPLSGAESAAILTNRGYKVSLFDISQSPLPIRKIQEANLDFVLNLAQAVYDSPLLKPYIAGLFDILQLPYTGSGSSTLALAADKIKTKKLLDYHGIPTPAWDYVEEMEDEIDPNLKFPLIVKPANSDNAFGINNESVVTNERDLKKQLEIIVEELKRPALIEEYIEGDEFDVCILGNDEDAEILPLIRSIFDRMPKPNWHIYHSALKNQENEEILKSIRLEKPAKIPKKLDSLISEMSLDVFNIFDCRDYLKMEMRVDKNGNPFVLELNPNPPIHRDDFLPMAAKLAGYSYEDLLEEIIILAIQRYKDHPPFYHLSSIK